MGKREKIRGNIRKTILRFKEDKRQIISELLKFFLNKLQLNLNTKIQKFYWLCKKYLEPVLSNSTCPLYFSYVRMLGFLQLRNMKYTILLLQKIRKLNITTKYLQIFIIVLKRIKYSELFFTNILFHC